MASTQLFLTPEMIEEIVLNAGASSTCCQAYIINHHMHHWSAGQPEQPKFCAALTIHVLPAKVFNFSIARIYALNSPLIVVQGHVQQSCSPGLFVCVSR